MGVALHTQRARGEQADYPVVELGEALVMFNSIPWEKEIEAWSEMPDGEIENHRPLFQLMDDSEHSLRITAYSRDLMGLAYDYPVRICGTLAGPEFEQGYLATNQFPRASLRELLACFFSVDEERMLALLRRYPPLATHTDDEPEQGVAPIAADALSGGVDVE